MGLKFIYTNSNGDALEFSDSSGVFINSIDGLSTNSITLTESSSYDQVGSTLTGTAIQPKDLSFEGHFKENPQTRKSLLAVIRPDLSATLRYINTEADLDVYWEGYPSKTPVIDWSKNSQSFQFTFRASYPYAKKTIETVSKFYEAEGSVFFPRAFSETDGFMISTRKYNNLILVTNDGNTTSGFTFRAKCLRDDIASVRIKDQTSTDYIQLSGFGGLFATGDYIEIETTPNNVRVQGFNVKDGATTSFSMMKYLDLKSTFFLLDPGANNVELLVLSNDSKDVTDGVEAYVDFNEVLVGV